MEFLKSIFGNAALTYDQLAEKLRGSADVKLANLASGQYVDKGKFDAAQIELAGVREQLKSANEAIDGFKKLDPEGLKKAAQEWKDKHAADTAALQEKIKSQAKDAAVRLAVAKENVHDDTLTMAALDLGKVAVAEDGTVSGLSRSPPCGNRSPSSSKPAGPSRTTTPPAEIRREAMPSRSTSWA